MLEVRPGVNTGETGKFIVTTTFISLENARVARKPTFSKESCFF